MANREEEEAMRLFDMPVEEEVPQEVMDLFNAPPAPPVPVEAPVSPVEASEPDFGARMRAILDKRQEQQSGAFEKAFDGSDGGMLSTAKLLGKTAGNAVAGTALDVGAELIATGMDAVVPEPAQEAFKEFTADVAKWGMDKEVVKWGMKEWDKLSTDKQDMLGAAGNIFSFMLPKMPKSMFKGDKMVSKGKMMKQVKMSEQLKLPITNKTKAADAKKRFKTSELDDNMVKEVMLVKGISPLKGPETNMELMFKQVDSIEAKLDKDLVDNPVDIPNDELFPHLDASIDNVRMNNEWIALDDTLDKAFNTHLKTMDRILKRHPKTAVGIRQARKEFDDIAFDKDSGGTGDLLKIKEAASKAVRDGLNNAVKSGAARVGVDVAKPQQRMFMLLRGTSNLAEKYGADTSWGKRAIRKLEAHPIYAVGIAGGSITLPATAAMALTGYLGYKAAQAVAPTAVKAAGHTVNAVVPQAARAGAFGGNAILRNFEEDKKGEMQ